MSAPKTGADLQQFICAMQWMRSGIFSFSTIVRPLLGLLETVYKASGKRTRRAAVKVSLANLNWNLSHEDAFRKCKEALQKQITLVHLVVCKRLCVSTDASDFLWSGVVTQILVSDQTLPFADQRHVPLAFLSGHFKDAELRWSTLEKEAHAIMATIERMHWVLATNRGFDLFTDHNNIVFLFNPTAVMSDLSQTTMRKTLRWADCLSSYNYVCVHIPGSLNVWADIISRWTSPPILRRLVTVPVLPSSSSKDFVWPSSREFSDAKLRHLEYKPTYISKAADDFYRTSSGAIWVPGASNDIQLRLWIIAHTGASGRRGLRPTLSALSSRFWCSMLSADVATFVSSCIHCLSTTGGGKIPRPYGPAVHGTAPNDLLQFDYIDISPATSGEKYILMLRDDHSSYCWLFACTETTAENAARAIIDWSAAFGVPQGLMSDGPTHFRNETIRLVCKGLHVPHHFTLPYTSWSNGGVERLGKELLCVFRSISSELHIRTTEWPYLLPLVQSTLIISSSSQRAGIPPIKSFTGLNATPPTATFYRSSVSKPVSILDVNSERILSCKQLCKMLADLRPVVEYSLQSNRHRHCIHVGKGHLPNFTEGDFVLVAREDFNAGEKLSLRWCGPRRVLRPLNDYVYQVEDLRNGAIDNVHATRLKFFMILL